MSGTVLRPDVEHAPPFKPGDRVVVTVAYYRRNMPSTRDLVGTEHVVSHVITDPPCTLVHTTKGYQFSPRWIRLLPAAVPVHESFHNVYSERTGNMRVSRRAADRNADPDRLAVVHIRLWADGAVTADVEQVTT